MGRALAPVEMAVAQWKDLFLPVMHIEDCRPLDQPEQFEAMVVTPEGR